MLRLAAIAAGLLLVAGCGGGDDEPNASPGDEKVTGFTEGDFDDVPRLPESEELDPPTTQDDGTIAASYLVQGPRPVGAVRDLRRRLEADGWLLTAGPTRSGQAVRAEFVRERERLEVSAFPATAFEQSYEDATQYSLLLRPDLDPASTTVP